MDQGPKTDEFVVGDSFARILTEATQSLVCVYDRDGRIIFFNDACSRATGFSRDEVIGRDARDVVIPAEEGDAFGEVLAFIWKTKHSSPQVGHWLTKDGGRRLVAWSNKLMIGDDGEPLYLVTAGIDLTDRARDTEGEPGCAGRRDSQAAHLLTARGACPQRLFVGPERDHERLAAGSVGEPDQTPKAAAVA